MKRDEILDTAKELICNEREKNHGDPADNFEIISTLWVDYLIGCGVNIDFLDGEDIAAMMILVKIARIITGNKNIDNWIDIAGYAALRRAAKRGK